MVLRLLAHAAGHWTATRLNDYLRDNDEYRATTRNLLHLGGAIDYRPTAAHPLPARADPDLTTIKDRLPEV